MKQKRPRMRNPKPLADLLEEGLASLGLGERLREFEIWRLWPEVVGPAIASRAQPLRIINRVLTVAVSSGPWMQELNFLKGMIREKLNSRLGSEVVTEIALKSGKVASFIEIPDTDPLPQKPLTARQLELINQQAAQIADVETREAFSELMKASLANSRYGSAGK